MGAHPPASPRALRAATARGLRGGTWRHCPRPLLSPRCGGSASPAGAHGAAHAPHARRAAAPVGGCATGPPPSRPAASAPPNGRRRPRRGARAAPPRLPHPSGDKLAGLRGGLLDLAPACRLRAGPRLGLVAPRRAPLLLRRRHALLAPRHPRLAGAIAAAAVGGDPVSPPRGAPEHDPRRHPRLLGSGDLP